MHVTEALTVQSLANPSTMHAIVHSPSCRRWSACACPSWVPAVPKRGQS